MYFYTTQYMITLPIHAICIHVCTHSTHCYCSYQRDQGSLSFQSMAYCNLYMYIYILFCYIYNSFYGIFYPCARISKRLTSCNECMFVFGISYIPDYKSLLSIRQCDTKVAIFFKISTQVALAGRQYGTPIHRWSDAYKRVCANSGRKCIMAIISKYLLKMAFC